MTELPSSSELGALKDEYPGDLLDVKAYQPKVYTLTKSSPFDGEHLPGCFKSLRCKDDDCKGAKATPPCAKCHGCATTKTQMKGFPKEQRTEENLARLRRGLVVAARGEELAEEDVIRWRRQEKVRTLARGGFKNPPAMVKVSKNWKSPYDKRAVLPDGSTRPLIAEIRDVLLDNGATERRTMIRCSSVCADPDPATGAPALRLCELDAGHAGLHRGSEVPWELDRLPASLLEWDLSRDAGILFMEKLAALDEAEAAE